VRIATWNINDINKRLPLLLTWLETTQPDVVALQTCSVLDTSTSPSWTSRPRRSMCAGDG
jgi:exonuclease III